MSVSCAYDSAHKNIIIYRKKRFLENILILFVKKQRRFARVKYAMQPSARCST